MLLFLMGCACAHEVRAQAQAQEHEIKAAFIYNFISFTEWPGNIGTTIDICTMGNDQLNIPLDALQNKLAKGAIITVRHLRSGDEMKGCHVVFISDSERINFPAILASLKSAPTLTVTDSEGLAAQGVMIELGLEERRIVFKININAAKQAQDVLYIHDTIELFSGALPALSALWTKTLAPTLSAKTAKTVEQSADQIFASVTDVIRDAVRIPQDRTISPERLRALCALALSQILAERSDH